MFDQTPEDGGRGRAPAINVLGGIVVLYAFGIAGMLLRTDLTFWAALSANVTFLPGDLLKAVVAAAVAAQVHRAYPGLIASRVAAKPAGDLAHWHASGVLHPMKDEVDAAAA